MRDYVKFNQIYGHGVMRYVKESLIPILAGGLLAGCATTMTDTASTQPHTPPSRAVSLQIQLGIAYMQEGNFELAMKRLKRALELDPDSADVHNAIALLYQRLNQNEDAERHFREAIRFEPAFSSAHTNYGSFLCSTDRPAEGENEFLEAVQNPLYKRKDLAYLNAGLCMQRYGEIDKADTYLRRSLEEDPGHPVALLRMCKLSFDKGRFLPARAYLQRYEEVGRNTPGSLWLGYQIENKLGDKNAASSYAVLLRGSFPDSNETRLLEESGYE